MIDRIVVPSLEDTCVRWISKNLSVLTVKCSDCPEPKCVWRFAKHDYRIVARPAQKILLRLCKRGVLVDEYLNLFSSRYVDLVSPVLKDVSLSSSALRILREFKLFNLTAINLKQMNLNSLIGCLNEASAESLISLNVSSAIIEESKRPVMVSLRRLKNLQVLNVSRTKFTSDCLENVVHFLPQLRHLNISRTNITSIGSLTDLSTTLTGLVMHRLISSTNLEKVLNTVLQLRELRVLDISSEYDKGGPRLSPGVDQLCSKTQLPHITHIDISGNQFRLTLADVTNFIENHPNLEFAGLAAWPSRQKHELDGIYQLSLKYPHITMLGDRGEKPLLATLTRNKDRRKYLQNAFHNIFEETSSREWLNPDLLAAVLRVMRLHNKRQDMILAGTAVVYNLTRGEQSAQLPQELLNRAVNITLDSIDQHQMAIQLLKNCFLTLCSDTVLHRAHFNCKRCCELVFRSLINFDDVHMKRMGVAIISILAAEIPTSDLRDLSSDRQRLEKLLIYVVEKCLLKSDVEQLLMEPRANMLNYLTRAKVSEEGSPVYDTTLRFTLSALWNLTDECPEACYGFVHVGGLLIYTKVLKKMADQDEDFKNHVYTKCLGLLNNVAEVSSTKTTLLIEPLMDFFNKMLSHRSIQISYFAAGIVSHLACLSDDTWESALHHKADYIRVLGEAVCKWSPPQTEMVAYRSFQPFQSLILHENSCLEIHLWAVWAIHHILTKKDSRYVPVLRECLDLQLFLVYVVSTDPTSLCAAEAQFCQFLDALALYHSKVTSQQPPLFSNKPSSPCCALFIRSLDVDNFVPSSWHQFVQLIEEHLNFVEPGEFVAEDTTSQSSDNMTAFGGYCNHNGDGGDVSMLPFWTPSDSVTRLPSNFDNGVLTPSATKVAATTVFVGPTEAQLESAVLLQRLAREILQTYQRFEGPTWGRR